ncbi:hypothetical protein [Tetragenococcus koreensis]|uniref:Uncharacterized protein n=1 Tax=Tetragenococcus koreensis TaxID=290335 RepID=A0AAN4UCA4_9ENTE|nr:hypothetical protein [Tetragenococcus koreensis]MDN6291633.1 hypothetical protein [Tetragenococcus halophilus]MDN6640900.1 hypothetical protein [Tetragenococcus sp.]MCF1584566.1 hypothetical protein [Tetragenococcus koreensis]MCF1628889.1 hypothetical protein [Tetragenococcus koreensis]MCF1641917.1 hypothetical protein [Tetragenococcus koreensis]
MRQVKILYETTPYGMQEKINNWVKENGFHLVDVDIKNYGAYKFAAIVLYEDYGVDQTLDIATNELKRISDKLDDMLAMYGG